jgi:predicted XRE-type DNA-binding protein
MKSYKSAFELITDDAAQIKLYELKSQLMNCINDHIKDLELTQLQASKVMKVTQARVSNVATGKIDKFTYDLLFLMCERISEE